jgi:hypothetical protein
MDADERHRRDAPDKEPGPVGAPADDADDDDSVVEEILDLFNAREAVDPTTSSTGEADDEAGPASDADAQAPG